MAKKNQEVVADTAEMVTEAPATEKAVVVSTIVCPHCNGEITVERAAAPRRGQLAGLDIAEMSNDQLKREKINAGSVLYKAIKRGASAETIAKNQARFDAVKAELEIRGVSKTAAPASETTDEVYNADVAASM